MARYTRRRKTVRPFRAMRKARMYSSRGYAAFGRKVGRFIGRKISNQIHTFKKSIMLSGIFETGADQHLAYQFNLDQLADESDFQNLYDAYKIVKIILNLEPQFSGTNTNAVAPYQKWMRVVHDYDDVTPLSNENQYLDYAGVKSHSMTSPRMVKIPLYPKIQIANQTSGGTGVIYRPVSPGWIPTASDQVDHLGLKLFVPTLGLTNGYAIFRVRATFVIKCKNSK